MASLFTPINSKPGIYWVDPKILGSELNWNCQWDLANEWRTLGSDSLTGRTGTLLTTGAYPGGKKKSPLSRKETERGEKNKTQKKLNGNVLRVNWCSAWDLLTSERVENPGGTETFHHCNKKYISVRMFPLARASFLWRSHHAKIPSSIMPINAHTWLQV